MEQPIFLFIALVYYFGCLFKGIKLDKQALIVPIIFVISTLVVSQFWGKLTELHLKYTCNMREMYKIISLYYTSKTCL